MRDFFETLRRDRNAFRDTRQKRADFFGSGWTAESDQQAPHRRDDSLPNSPGAELMHGFDHCDHILDGSFRQNAMAQIENVPGPTAGAA